MDLSTKHYIAIVFVAKTDQPNDFLINKINRIPMGASKLEGYDTEMIANAGRLFALGHAARLSIINQLIEGPKNQAELTFETRITSRAIQQHVSILKREKLVAGKWKGKKCLLRINKKKWRETVEYIQGMNLNIESSGLD